MKTLTFLLFVSMLLTLSACSSLGIGGTPDIRFYSLSAVSKSTNTTPSNLKIGIGPVKLPRQLKRPQIITRINPNELKMSEDHQWVGSLKEDITQVLTDNLSTLTGTEQIEKFPWKRRFKPNYQIRIQIEQFTGELGGSVTLKARWWLRENNAATDRLAKKSEYTVATKGTDYTHYIEALSLALDKLSVEIAKELRTNK